MNMNNLNLVNKMSNSEVLECIDGIAKLGYNFAFKNISESKKWSRVVNDFSEDGEEDVSFSEDGEEDCLERAIRSSLLSVLGRIETANPPIYERIFKKYDSPGIQKPLHYNSYHYD